MFMDTKNQPRIKMCKVNAIPALVQIKCNLKGSDEKLRLDSLASLGS